MEEAMLLCFAMSLLFWIFLHLLLKLFINSEKDEWNRKLIGIFQGILTSLLAIISSVLIGPCPISYIGQPNTMLHNWIVNISAGFFLFDIMWLVWHQLAWKRNIIIIHHIMTLVGIAYVLYNGIHGCELVLVLGAFESTNPCLQIRWFMRKLNWYHGRGAMMFDYMYTFSFLVIRMLAGTLFFAYFMLHPAVTCSPKIGIFLFQLMNYHFVIDVFSSFCDKYL